MSEICSILLIQYIFLLFLKFEQINLVFQQKLKKYIYIYIIVFIFIFFHIQLKFETYRWMWAPDIFLFTRLHSVYVQTWNDHSRWSRYLTGDMTYYNLYIDSTKRKHALENKLINKNNNNKVTYEFRIFVRVINIYW